MIRRLIALRVHICNINDMLSETDMRIMGNGGFYKLVDTGIGRA